MMKGSNKELMVGTKGHGIHILVFCLYVVLTAFFTCGSLAAEECTHSDFIVL